MIKFFRRISSTVGLIALWAHLYPFILKVINVLPYRDNLAFGWIHPEFIQSVVFKVATLLYLTFWFSCYLDGFFNEWSLVRFQLLQIMACGCRWLLQSIVRLFMPFLVSLGEYWGLVHFTAIPSWLQVATAVVFFLILMLLGWYYPGTKVTQIRYWKRFQ